jgi:hypothetical protein|tara:strand:+ start:196 stop:324 length:129 start_codon:yes stop_codon:yes gene_type:complete
MKNHKDILTLYLKKYLYKKDGAVRRVRTGGLLIGNQTLYQLS